MSDAKEKDKRTHQEKLNWVYKEFAAAIFLIVVIFYVGYRFLPVNKDQLKTNSDRQIYTIRCLFLSSFSILTSVFGVLDVRGNTNAIDPIGGGSEHLVELPNRILRNTVEQFSLHAIGLLTLASFLNETNINVIPTLVIIFLLGRLFFWLGYRSSPLNRGFGFAMTFLPTLAVYTYCTYYVISNVFS